MSIERQQNHSDQNIEVNHIVPVTEEARNAAFIMFSGSMPAAMNTRLPMNCIKAIAAAF